MAVEGSKGKELQYSTCTSFLALGGRIKMLRTIQESFIDLILIRCDIFVLELGHKMDTRARCARNSANNTAYGSESATRGVCVITIVVHTVPD